MSRESRPGLIKNQQPWLLHLPLVQGLQNRTIDTAVSRNTARIIQPLQRALHGLQFLNTRFNFIQPRGSTMLSIRQVWCARTYGGSQ